MQYQTCPHCGANLDPGERCDCTKQKAAQDADTSKSGNLRSKMSISQHQHDTTPTGAAQEGGNS